MIPAPNATKETLLRRATYDLTGLPPSLREMLAFPSDSSPQAFAKVIDRLLASSAYGERWGRFWLDSAHYSDTSGGDNPNPKRPECYYQYAWTYRDYVIKALNDDKPYDQFIVEQLTAAQLPDIQPNDERLAALGFLTLGERFNNRNDIINDRIDTMRKAFLALTVACARGHDHQFDPIPTADYYALHGIFTSTIEPNEKPSIAQPGMDFKAFQKQLAALEQRDRTIYYRVIGKEFSKSQEMVANYLLSAMRKNRDEIQQAKKPRKPFVPGRKLDPEILDNNPRAAPFERSELCELRSRSGDYLPIKQSNEADRRAGSHAERRVAAAAIASDSRALRSVFLRTWVRSPNHAS